METMTAEEFCEQQKGQPKIRVSDPIDRTFNDIVFDSKDEMHRYKDLLLLQKAGEIWDLKHQPKYELLRENFHPFVEGVVRSIIYTADFYYRKRYTHPDGRIEHRKVVEDVKGFKWSKHKTPRKLPICNETFRLKRKLMLYYFRDIDFRVVDKNGDRLL